MTHVSIRKAKADLPRLIERVEAGEEIVIVRDGTPVACLIPHKASRRFGRLRGRISVPDSFFDPLPERELSRWK